MDKSDGKCKEVCGDGTKLTNRIECDDGNQKSGAVDGCDENCNIEKGWECYVNDARKSVCSKTLPFKAGLEI
jgi:cysteine-rich repeat protein